MCILAFVCFFNPVISWDILRISWGSPALSWDILIYYSDILVYPETSDLSWDVLILPEISWSILRCQENFLRYPQDILRFPAIVWSNPRSPDLSWAVRDPDLFSDILRISCDILRLIWHCPVILGDLSWYLLRFPEILIPGLVNSHKKRTGKWTIEMFDLSIKHGDIPVRYVTVYQRVSPVNFLRYPEDILINPDDTVIYS